MGEVLVEVVPKTQASGNLSRTPTVPEDFGQRANEVMAATLDVANQLRAKLEQAPLTAASSGLGLQEVHMKFGLTLQAESGVIIAKVGAAASFEVTLTWKKATG